MNKSIWDKIRDGDYIPTKTAKKDGYVEFIAERAKRLAEFEKDLAFEFGVQGNLKAHKVFSIAWEMGHAEGLAEVYNVYSDIVELIK